MDSIATSRSTAMQRMKEIVRKARRNWTWTVHMFLSLVVMCSILDGFPLSSLSHMELFAFSVSCFSLVVSLMMAAMHYIESSKKFVGGTLFELVMALMLLGLWIAAVVVIQDPRHDIASTVGPTGAEVILQANLYLFTWSALFCNVYLVGSFFRDYRTYDFRVMGWVSVLAASLMLLGISNHLHEGICNVDDGVMCFRTQYSIVAGIIVSVISFIASVLSYKSRVSPKLGLILASPNSAIYAFGVVVLTSASGPGRTLGTIYITVWTGAIISILLLIGEFNEIFLDEKETMETISDAKKVIEIQMGDDNRSDTSEGSD